MTRRPWFVRLRGWTGNDLPPLLEINNVGEGGCPKGSNAIYITTLKDVKPLRFNMLDTEDLLFADWDSGRILGPAKFLEVQ